MNLDNMKSSKLSAKQTKDIYMLCIHNAKCNRRNAKQRLAEYPLCCSATAHCTTAPMHFLWQKVKAMGAPIVPCLIHSWGGKGTKIDVAGPVR